MAGGKGKWSASFKSKRRLIQEEQGSKQQLLGSWWKDDANQKKFERFAKKNVVFNHPVDWTYFKSAWSDVFQLFQCQFWYNFLSLSFPYYKDFILSIACNSFYSSEELEWKCEYMENEYILDSETFDELIMRDYSDTHVEPDNLVILPSFTPKEMPDCLSAIGWDKVYRVLIGMEITHEARRNCKTSSYYELTNLAKRVHKFVHLCIVPTTKRDHITVKQTWVVYHIMTEQPISLGSIWLDLVRDVYDGSSQVIKNPGWTSWFLHTSGVIKVCNNTIEIPIGKCLVDANLIKSSFTLIDGEWVYTGKKKTGSSSHAGPTEEDDNIDRVNTLLYRFMNHHSHNILITSLLILAPLIQTPSLPTPKINLIP